jgi:acetyl-CoA carboxylase carboxyltransferase component
MGGMQAANVLITVKKDQYKAKGKEMPKEEIEQLRKTIETKYNKEGSAFYSTSRLWDDGIIDPVDTRKVIAMGITMSLNKKFPEQKFGVFRM